MPAVAGSSGPGRDGGPLAAGALPGTVRAGACFVGAGLAAAILGGVLAAGDFTAGFAVFAAALAGTAFAGAFFAGRGVFLAAAVFAAGFFAGALPGFLADLLDFFADMMLTASYTRERAIIPTRDALYRPRPR